MDDHVGSIIWIIKDERLIRMISKVEAGSSVEDCYPFNAAPTMEMADLLKRRIVIIEDSIIPNTGAIAVPSALMDL